MQGNCGSSDTARVFVVMAVHVIPAVRSPVSRSLMHILKITTLCYWQVSCAVKHVFLP